MPNLSYFMPSGLVRLKNFERRFRALGLPPSWARSRIYRKALEETQLELIPKSLLSSLECVVDIGANVGDWSVGVALLTSARKIIAYEPVPAVFQQLALNTRHHPQIRCVQSALGNKEGYVEMNVHPMHQLSSVLTLRDEIRAVHGIEQDIASQIQVPVRILDEDLRDQAEISLLKIDVQGYEPQVFAGGPLVLRRTRALMVEVTYSSYYHGDVQFDELHRLISSIAPFKLWGISAPHCDAAGKPMWADAVYVQNKPA